VTETLRAVAVRRAVGRRAKPVSLVARVRRIGYGILCGEFIGFVLWSNVLYAHFSLTPDFAQYSQAWYLIAHGNLNPYDTMGRFLFWQNHSEFIMWPLAVFYWIWPHTDFLLWLQDACIVAAQAVALTWLCEIAATVEHDRRRAWLAGTGLALIVLCPWTWWAISFDFHSESLAVLFTALLARDLWNGRYRRAWLWIGCVLICGDVAGTYVAGLGLGLLLGKKGARRRGLALAGVGVAAVLFITLIHGNAGSSHGLQAYSYLADGGPKPKVHMGLLTMVTGILRHPATVAQSLWRKNVDMWANFGASGFVGIGFLPLTPILLIVTLANSLFRGILFAEPLFQSLPIYVLMPAATIGSLAWLMKRWPRITMVLSLVIVAQAIGWAAVWTPATFHQWLRVSDPTAATLARIAARIPPSAQVFVSQGVVGRFSSRTEIRPLPAPRAVPVKKDVWFIVVPFQGIETQSTAQSMEIIGQLSTQLHAKLITHANGVWAFRWHPPAGLRTVTVPDGTRPLPAWTAPGAAGRQVMNGPASTWHVTSTGRRGYVVDRLQWRRLLGSYELAVTLSATGPVNIEVWNDNGDKLLARQSIPSTHGVQTIRIPVVSAGAYIQRIFHGWGPFRADFAKPPHGQRLELRIWSPGTGVVNVYRASLHNGRSLPKHPS
jgi:uncharacterized membrane protein